MANKRLSLAQMEQMKTMVVNGSAPEDIAKHFQIAISSVHNYKKRFRDQGVKFPDVRGKRPSGSVQVQSVSNTITKNPSTPQVESKTSSAVDAGTLNVVVNGITMHISAEAKNVNIKKDGIEVTF